MNLLILLALAQGPQPLVVGNPLGLPITPTPDRAFEPISSNVKVYGAIYSAESCTYDGERGVIVVPNRGVPQTVQTNNAPPSSSRATLRTLRRCATTRARTSSSSR